VLEAGRPGKPSQLILVHQRIDMPAAAEALDRAHGCRLGRRPPDVVADHEQTAWPHEAATLGEEAVRLGAVHERLDRIREIRFFKTGWQISVVPFNARYPVR